MSADSSRYSIVVYSDDDGAKDGFPVTVLVNEVTADGEMGAEYFHQVFPNVDEAKACFLELVAKWPQDFPEPEAAWRDAIFEGL